jgi:acyl-coenzyme A synthetase/AMP-(fatty) acid ligase
MLRYWRRSDGEAQVFRGEWFVGGDLGVIDDDGYITHIGRSDELMNAGGYRVSPHEVEAALAHCPGVAEVACTEFRVRSDVSVIAVFVVQTGGLALDAVTIKAFAAGHLAAYKVQRKALAEGARAGVETPTP